MTKEELERREKAFRANTGEEYPTCLKLIVTVTGDKLDSVCFSELVNLSPTASCLKGDDTTHYPNSLGRKTNCWQYEFDNVVTRELEPLVNSFKGIFGTKVGDISKYIKENDLKMELDVISDINYGIIPSYYIDKEFMSLLVQMNADINFEQEYFEGFVDDSADWKIEQKREVVKDNMLLYAFDDEVTNKFVYDETNRRLELSFEGCYDVVNEKSIDRNCVLIIEQWDKAMSKCYPSNKFKNMGGNLGIISMIMFMEVMEEKIRMVVSTINCQHYEIVFDRASVWLLVD